MCSRKHSGTEEVKAVLMLLLLNERIANVFVDFGSAKHGKIDERLICRATHKICMTLNSYTGGVVSEKVTFLQLLYRTILTDRSDENT